MGRYISSIYMYGNYTCFYMEEVQKMIFNVISVLLQIHTQLIKFSLVAILANVFENAIHGCIYSGQIEQTIQIYIALSLFPICHRLLGFTQPILNVCNKNSVKSPRGIGYRRTCQREDYGG